MVVMQILNVTASVLQFLREKIIVGELKPGHKLNELSLSADLGISRPPLREAFRILERDHLVLNIPRKGTYVTKLSIKDFVDVSQTREMIECYSIDLFKASDVRNLPKVTTALNRALSLPLPQDNVDSEKLLNYVKVLLDFHTSLIESTGNSLLSSIYNAISFNLARYQFIYFHMDSTAQHSLDAHSRILGLINSGDYDRAKEEMRKHIHYAMDLVKNRILHPAIA